MKKLISFVMAGAMVASLVPATAFAAGEVTATAKIVDALELTKDEAKNKPEINEGNYNNDVPELQLKITGVDYRVTDSASATMDVTLTLDNAEFLSLSDADLLALVSAKGERGDFLAVTGASWQNSATGSKMSNDGGTTIKNLPAAEDAVDNYADATVKLSEKYGKDITVSGTSTAAVTLTKTDEAEVTVVAAGGSDFDGVMDSDAVVAKLKDGWSLTDAEKVLKISNLDGDTISVVSARVPAISVDEVIARDFAGYTRGDMTGGTAPVSVQVKEKDDDEVTYKFTGKFEKDDIIAFDMESELTKSAEGTKATVSVDSKMVTADDLVYATVLGEGLKVSVKKTVDIAEEEVAKLNDKGLKIETSVGNFAANQKITLRLSKGFEFVKAGNVAEGASVAAIQKTDDNELTVTVAAGGANEDELTINGIEIEAVSAKSGAVATITAKSSNFDSASCEVAKVVDYKVSLTVDEDEDVPVIYSGVNVANDGITDDSDHMSLEVTAEETFPGAWSMRQGFNFNLPEGVYVTNVDVVEAENFVQNGSAADETDWTAAFFNAYQDGDHKNFEFGKRVFDDVNVDLEDDPAKLTFKLELVADPTFEGEVKLTMEGSLVDKQEVTIAKFVKPYTVKAEQNDLIIDYRNTEIPTAITVTEAEEGLWAEGTKAAKFTFKFDKDNVMEFEDDATFEIDADSELEVKDTTKDGTLSFYVKEESDSAATVTIKDMKLFMNRSIPAGAYDLKIETSLAKAYEAERLFAADHDTLNEDNTITVAIGDDEFDTNDHNKTDKDCYVGDVCDYSSTVKEAFVNVVTSGRDQDNLFTTKVVVPVGEKYLVAGENKVELDVAAYISDAGYTMLPVRAISKALGVNTNNVLWNAEARTVTIMYGQRIITMTVGQKTIYVNGSAIPSSAAPEIKDGRTFLPLRDLGTALGVTDVSWDAATKTATMNGGAK